MNAVAQDNGTHPASPHYRETIIAETATCDRCEHFILKENGRKSLLTGEFYCTEGQSNCWELVAEEVMADDIANGETPKQFV